MADWQSGLALLRHSIEDVPDVDHRWVVHIRMRRAGKQSELNGKPVKIGDREWD